ncbi:hypothetical protein [Vibrio sp. WXL210]|uniref:hypothetical protein n=1 Tax=Vibrio sp. WXL210 TaxID=3450709 RepID=UPI003EC7B5BD
MKALVIALFTITVATGCATQSVTTHEDGTTQGNLYQWLNDDVAVVMGDEEIAKHGMEYVRAANYQ